MESVIDYFVKDISRINNISLPEASKKLDTCLKLISSTNNVEYSVLYNLLTTSGVSFCLNKSCEISDIQECGKLCHCVVYNNKCVPRYIKDANIINSDPDKYIKGISTKDLEDLLKYASYLYYNYDGGGLTDNSFDALEYTLNKRLKLKGRRYEKIGAEPIDKIKVNLPYPMGSLEKLKPEMKALREYISTPELFWSNKLDGVSGLVTYTDGKVTGIYSRGDGTVGGDLTYLKDYISLPKLNGDITVRGEFILPKNKWESKYKGSYANARSFVSSKVNSGHISPSFSDLDFVAYEIVDWTEPISNISQQMKILDTMGFKTPVNGTIKDPTIFNLVSIYKKQRETSPYNIDGLVINNGNESVAFKMLLEEQIRDSIVNNVDWNITRHGRYFPVAVYDSVYIDGIRLHRASAHNADHVDSWNLGKGSKIKVARSGDVIPQIKDVIVDDNIEPIFPGNEYEWDWEGKDIVLKDINNNPEVHKKRNTHFFTTIGVPGIGEGKINKLYENNFKNVSEITNAKIDELTKIKGFGKKSAETLYNNIHNTMRKTRLDRFLSAMTTFKSKVPRKLLKQVVREYPEIYKHSEKEITKNLKEKKIPGIGPKRIATLAESIPKFIQELKKLNNEDISQAIEWNENLVKTKPNLKVKGKEFVLTNFMNSPTYKVEDFIWDNFGDTSNIVTNKTDAVIAANLSTITTKMLNAEKFGIPVYTVEEFFEKFN